jgi:multisubunit Na+/H+ antiporter MnhB subunit
MTLELVLDVLVMAGLVAVAYRAIHAPALFTAVVLYIAFGLLLALVWVRLEAPDLALAEAAIGAGVTGALLLDAVGQLGSGSALRSRMGIAAHSVASLAALALASVLAVTVVTLADRSPSLSGAVVERLPASGVEHTVTAVLLNYRGYDTWLEVGVLLAAAVGVLAISRSDSVPRIRSEVPVNPIAAASAALLIPIALLIGGYLLWRGTHAPGGAFQAGAVIGATGILLILTGGASRLAMVDGVRLRVLLSAGFIAFLAVGCATLLTGRFLEYPSVLAGGIILTIELAITVSTAGTLIVLFAGARGGFAHRKEPR